MITDLSLTAPYEPKAIYFHDADYVEYLREDVPCVYRRIDERLTIAFRADTRTPIGFRIKGFRNFYLKTFKPLHDRLGEACFISLVQILEKLVEQMGHQVFDDDSERAAAYRTVVEMARKDRVELHELPTQAA
jgi:hypothetical protein